MASINNANGYINYSIEDSEIILDKIEVFEKRKGTGTELLNELKAIARELDMRISLYAYPQNDSIEEDDLIDFYKNNGFECDSDDCDGRLLEWR